MRNLPLILLLFLAAPLFGQKSETIKLADLENMMSERSDKVLIVNFWATWCAPCVKELPLFEKITEKADPNVEIALVSMDLDLDPNPEKVHKFVARKNLKSSVFLLDETNPNEWIDKIEPQWSGALPATIIINQKTGQRKFIEKELHEGELEKLIKEIQEP